MNNIEQIENKLLNESNKNFKKAFIFAKTLDNEYQKLFYEVNYDQTIVNNYVLIEDKKAVVLMYFNSIHFNKSLYTKNTNKTGFILDKNKLILKCSSVTGMVFNNWFIKTFFDYHKIVKGTSYDEGILPKIDSVLLKALLKDKIYNVNTSDETLKVIYNKWFLRKKKSLNLDNDVYLKELLNKYSIQFLKKHQSLVKKCFNEHNFTNKVNDLQQQIANDLSNKAYTMRKVVTFILKHCNLKDYISNVTLNNLLYGTNLYHKIFTHSKTFYSLNKDYTVIANILCDDVKLLEEVKQWMNNYKSQSPIEIPF
jgi:hypothetical protein